MANDSQGRMSSEERTILVLAGLAVGIGVVGTVGADLASLLHGVRLPHQSLTLGIDALKRSDALKLWPSRPPGQKLVIGCDIAAGLLMAVVAWGLYRLGRGPLHRLVTGAGPASEPTALRNRQRDAESLGCDPKESPGIIFGDTAFGRYDEPVFVLGQPGSGKSVWLTRNVLHTPGPAIVTSTKPEMALLTAGWHVMQGRPVWIWDLGAAMELDDDLRLRWDPLASITRQSDARIMARRFAFAGGLGGEDDAVWLETGTTVLGALFWAAALCRRDPHSPLSRVTMADVRRWVFVPTEAHIPIEVLKEHGYVSEAEELARNIGTEAQVTGGQVTASVMLTLSAALGGFAEAALLDACSPHAYEHFDVRRFVDERGIVYIVGSPEAQRSAAGVVAAMIEDTLEQVRAYKVPQRPPLVLWLDEAPNMAVLGSLPEIVTTGRGEGICPVIIGQTLAKFKESFGVSGASTIREACVVELAYGGQKDIDYLRSLEALSGETTVESWSTSYGADGTSSRTRSERVKPRYSVDELRSLAPPNAWLVDRHRSLRPVRTTPWWQHADGRRVASAVAWAMAHGYAKPHEVPRMGRHERYYHEELKRLQAKLEEVSVDAPW